MGRQQRWQLPGTGEVFWDLFFFRMPKLEKDFLKPQEIYRKGFFFSEKVSSGGLVTKMIKNGGFPVGRQHKLLEFFLLIL